MIRQLSRYAPRYPRSLVYMLQASEYSVGEYFDWYGRVRDFRRVEHRKRLDPTPKARLLLLSSYGMLAVLYLAALSLILAGLQFGALLLAAGVLLALVAPIILAYALPLPLWAGRKLIQEPRERKMIEATRAALAAHPAFKIGIAGSYGKTSVKELLLTVLSSAYGEGEVKATPGNLNTPAGISRFSRRLSGSEKILIFELGEYYPGDIMELCELVHPELGVITGINEAHLSKFKTLESTQKTIFELGDYLDIRPFYGNAESRLVAEGKDKYRALLLYSRTGVNGWRIEEAVTDVSGLRFLMRRDDKTISVKSALLGLHQVGPLAAVADIAYSRLKEEGRADAIEVVERGLARTRPFEHRLQPRDDASGAIFIDDTYNGNPDGAAAAIEFLGQLEGYRRRFYVTPGLVEMGARTEEVHREIGRRLAQAGIEAVVLVRNSVAPFIQKGLDEAGFSGEVILFDDALKMYEALPHRVAHGDVVLLQNDWPDNYA